MKQTLLLSYLISLIFSICGAMIKIMHWPNGNLLLVIGLLAYLAFVVIAIIEVQNTPRLSFLEKLLWSLGLVFFNTITGLLYVLYKRNEIIKQTL